MTPRSIRQRGATYASKSQTGSSTGPLCESAWNPDHGRAAGDMDLADMIEVEAVDVVPGRETVVHRVGVDVVQVQENAAAGADAEAIEERLFRQVLIRIANVVDAVFQQERAGQQVGQVADAWDQKLQHLEVVGDRQSDGGVHLVPGADARERQVLADPGRLQALGPADQVVTEFVVEDLRAADRQADGVQDDRRLARRLLEPAALAGHGLETPLRGRLDRARGDRG